MSSFTLPLCQTIQSSSVEIATVLHHTENLILVLKDFLASIDEKFSSNFEDATKLLHSFNEEMRISSSIINVKSKDKKRQYRKISIAIPFFFLEIFKPLREHFDSILIYQISSHFLDK